MTDQDRAVPAIAPPDEFAKALGGEYGGTVSHSHLTWTCACGAGGKGGETDLYRHRQTVHQNGRSGS